MAVWKKVIVSGSSADLTTLTLDTTLAVAEGGTGVTAKTGTTNLVLSNSPTLVTPALGTPSALVLTNATALPAAQVAQGTLASGMVLVAPVLGTPASGTMTNVTGTSGITGLGTQTTDLEMGGLNIQTAGVITLKEQADADGDVAGEGQLWVDTATPNVLMFTDDAGTDHRLNFSTSAMLRGMLSDETGTGGAVFATSPTLVTPVLGTPASGDLQNCTALPAAQVTQGSLASGMVLVAPALGTPASGVMTNVTGTAASLTAGTATVATTVTITDNESTDEENALTFVAGADADGGNVGLESDGHLTYNPGSGTVTATEFVGGGAGITGISPDIDELTAFSGVPHATQDEFLISDNGTELRATMTMVANGAFALVSGDATVAAGGALTIGAGTVENSMLADDAVDSDELAAGAVDLAHMSANSVDSDQYVDASIDNAHLAANSVDSDNYVDASIDNAHIADDAIDSEHYAAGSIDTAHIADNQITLAKMAGLARGKVIIGDASGDPSALAAGADGKILVADANGDITWTTVSGDATLSAGAVTLGTVGANHVTEISNLTAVEGAQLENIDSVTISNGQWAYVGALDQDLITTSDVTFADITATGDLTVTGNINQHQVTNINIEDQFILLHSGSSGTADSGIIFGGTSGTVSQGKALIWDASYNSNDGRLAVSSTDVAWNSTSAFGAGTAGYYVAGVFEGSTADAATAKADHPGNIKITSSEIFIYV